MQISDQTIGPPQLTGIRQNLIENLNHFYQLQKDYLEMSQKKYYKQLFCYLVSNIRIILTYIKMIVKLEFHDDYKNAFHFSNFFKKTFLTSPSRGFLIILSLLIHWFISLSFVENPLVSKIISMIFCNL